MNDIEQKQAIGQHWFGSQFDWTKASADEQAVVLAMQREVAPADSPARRLAKTIVEPIRDFVARSLALRDARIADLERKVASLEGEKAGKPRIKLRAISGRDD